MERSDDRITGPNISRVAEIVRRFGAYGFMTDRAYSEADAIAYVAELIADVRAPREAPQAVRDHLEVLCELHRHGPFMYGFFAFAVTQAHLGLELALGLLFVQAYPDGVPFVEKKGHRVENVAVQSFEEVRRRLDGGLRVEGHPRFNGMLGSLLDWGRETGALAPWLDRLWARHGSSAPSYEVTRGEGSRIPDSWQTMTPEERGRWLETDFRCIWERDLLVNERELRNGLAHRTGPFVTSPIESARAIRSYAEMVDALWGNAAPDDRQDAG